MKQPTSYLFLLSALFLEQSSAFQAPRVVRRESALHLLPGQGNQLVAAFNAACHEKEDVEGGVVATISTKVQEEPKEECHRSIVSRIFSLPSNLIKKHPHPKAEGIETERDVVLYPMVGFSFFPTADGGCVSFPTKSDAACRLVKTKDEEVYGWFSPSCELDAYSEDICHAPEEENK
eukprot:CAMPEP_0117009170 /NCGR_PEP_ID=MMETSP0472-20121206/8407_1 /TAXON_ID=693140 ORGANISM="Tiarina fusus, Strain LIS" /NCGR_SAMPLE_ID=MMETSP0472 /ASSEMBLY_ACC=CAM_ASM_000603 /LENGTH=176 /DNA_ID=CAMNT_0004711385 /DNA_START=70 /DNA_END=600 /DNA_ORIENTATION=+